MLNLLLTTVTLFRRGKAGDAVPEIGFLENTNHRR